MDKTKNCTACNKKLDKDNYKKDRIVSKECFKRKQKKIEKNFREKIGKRWRHKKSNFFGCT